MITEKEMNDIWTLNKSRFPETLNQEGVELIDNTFSICKNFILSLPHLPDRVFFTMTKEYSVWFGLKWGGIQMNWNIDVSKDVHSVEVFAGEEDLGTEEGNGEEIRNFINMLNVDMLNHIE